MNNTRLKEGKKVVDVKQTYWMLDVSIDCDPLLYIADIGLILVGNKPTS